MSRISFSFLCTILLLSFYTGNIFTQEKWSVDPRMTAVYATGSYVQLPQVKTNFTPAPQQTRIIRTPYDVLVIPPNFRPHPDAGATQSECPLVRDKQLPNILFGSANTVWPPNGFSGIGEGVYVTTNGGTSWYGYDTINGGTPINNHGGDPGPAIDKNGTFIMSHLGYTSAGMFANYSTNFGVSWSPSVTLVSGSMDKNLSGSDDAPSSPFYGRSYTVWSNFTLGAPAIVVSYTTNGGVSWSAMAQINAPPASHYSQGCDVAVGPAGQVYVVWAAPILGSPYTEDFYGFASSTNGGVTWSVTENAYDGNGIRGFLSNKSSIRVNAFPRIAVDRTGGARNGWIYVTGNDANLSPAGSTPDIILHRSSNGGVTWMAPVRVNQDPINTHYHWLPAVCVDDSGAVDISYYDDRNVGGNQAQFYMSRSIDGGTTFTDIQVSDHNFTPAPIPGLATGYQGDYTGIQFTNGKIYPWWCDPSSGFYQVWTVAIVPGPPPPPLAHDIAVGPFLSFPGFFVLNTPYAIKTKVQNVGTSNETGVPIRFYINGTLTNTTNINLNTTQVDSVSNTWTPIVSGTYTLKYISALATDTNRTNDTVQSTITVSSFPQNPPFFNYNTVVGTNTFPFGQAGGKECQWLIRSTELNQPSLVTNGNIAAVYFFMGSTASATFTDLTIKIGQTALTSLPAGVIYTGPMDTAYFRSSVTLSCTTGQWMSILLDRPHVYDSTQSLVIDVSQCGASVGAMYVCQTTLTGTRRNYINHSGSCVFAYAGQDGTCINFGVYLTPLVGLQHNNDIIPSAYSLSQNYPNPFNPVTKIDFALPKTGIVKLVVYDLLGAEVTTLVNENMQAGFHNVTFNGDNLASGVYFYRITAGEFTDVKKMLLIK